MRHSTAVASPVWANFMPPQRVARSGQVTLQGPGEFEVCARMRPSARFRATVSGLGLIPGLTGGDGFPGSKVPTSDDLRKAVPVLLSSLIDVPARELAGFLPP
jgi:hypothetical protein